MKLFMRILLVSIVIGGVFAPAALADGTLTDPRLPGAREWCKNWQRVFDRAEDRYLVARMCLENRASITGPSMSTPGGGETDPDVWLECGREFKRMAGVYQSEFPALWRQMTRPHVTGINSWRPLAQWQQWWGPSKNVVADAADVLRLLRQWYGPSPHLSEPGGVLRNLDRIWFANHARHPAASATDVEF